MDNIEYSYAPKNEPEKPKFTRPKRKLLKNWIIAERRPGIQQIQLVNKLTQTDYHRMLLKVKALYATVNEYVFEKDTKRDSTYNAATMHQFICQSLYFELECNFNDTYWVNTTFDQCPFENEIRRMLHSYPLNSRSRHFDLPCEVHAFFDRIKGEFDQACFYTLPAASV